MELHHLVFSSGSSYFNACVHSHAAPVFIIPLSQLSCRQDCLVLIHRRPYMSPFVYFRHIANIIHASPAFRYVCVSLPLPHAPDVDEAFWLLLCV